MQYNLWKTFKQINKAAMKFMVCDEARKVRRARLSKKLKSMLANWNAQAFAINPMHHKPITAAEVITAIERSMDAKAS